MTSGKHGTAGPRKWQPLSGGAVVVALVALALAAAACSDLSLPTSTDSPAATSVAAPSTAAGSQSSTAPVATEVEITDTGELLAGALASVGSRYEFESTVSLSGGALTSVSGRIYDGASSYLITTNGAELEYVLTPGGKWVRDVGGDWTELQEPPPVGDPLAALANPAQVEVISIEDETVTMAATYLGEELGFAEAGEVTIELVIVDSRLASLSYTAPAGGDTATVVTRFGTSQEIAPVTAPVVAG